MPGSDTTPTFEFPEDAVETAGRLAKVLGPDPSATDVNETLAGTGTGITNVMETVSQDPTATANLTGLRVKTVPEEPEEE